MRVLQVMASGARGGGAVHLRGLVAALRELGVESRVAVSRDGPLGEELRERGFEVIDLALMGSRLDPRSVVALARLARRGDVDLVHYHGTRAAFFGAAARRLAMITTPAVYTAHGLAYRKPLGWAARRAFELSEAAACRGATCVISVSGRDLEDLVGRGYLRRERGFHVPNALELERFAATDAGVARARLGLDPGRFVVGTVSRLVPQKSVHDLVEAMTHVRDATLVVIGDGPLRRELEELAAARQLDVRFLGGRDDVPQVLAALDVFALSSRWEGEPIALLEALAAGLPCVATRTEGALEVLEGCAAGVLVPIGEPRALGVELEALRCEPERRRTMAAQARRAVGNRTFAENARAVAGVYREARLRAPRENPSM